MFGHFSKLFHKQTNFSFKKGTVPTPYDKWPREWKEVSFKEYPRLEKVRLQKGALKSRGIQVLLTKRRSALTFDGRETCVLKNLSTLLYYTAGVREPGKSGQGKEPNWNATKRFYPSAGGLYPLEVYVIVQHVEGVNKGVYHYNVKEHSLEKLLSEKAVGSFKDAVIFDWARKASFFVIITGMWDRNFQKYGDRGYRLVLLEAGHMTQNLQLLATSLNIHTCPLAGFSNEKIDALLDINKDSDENAIYVIACGT